MIDMEPHEWRVAPVYWRDGTAGILAVAYIGFDLAGGPALDRLTCSVQRLWRIADFAGIDRDAFLADVIDSMNMFARETAAEWERRSEGMAAAYGQFCRGELLYVNSGMGIEMSEYLAEYVSDADQTWQGAS